MSCYLDIPAYPVGEPRPCVLRVTVVGDGREILGDYAMEIPVPTDRGDWHKLTANIQLMAGVASVGFAVALREREAAEAARKAVMIELATLGYAGLAEQLTKAPTRTEGTK